MGIGVSFSHTNTKTTTLSNIYQTDNLNRFFSLSLVIYTSYSTLFYSQLNNDMTRTTTTSTAPEEIKLSVLGAGGVGKSTITVQFVQNVFIEEYDPTTEDSYRKMFEVDGRHYLLDILDTAGPEEFSAMRDQYIRCSQGLIIVFALNDRRSFADIPEIVDQILRVKDVDSFPILMVGNKTDLEDERMIDIEEARAMARDLRIEYEECTAKKSVDHVFHHIIQSVKAYPGYKPFVEPTYHIDKKCSIM